MPPRAVFLDTNGWLALLSSSDSLHPIASTRWADLVKEGRSSISPKCLLPIL